MDKFEVKGAASLERKLQALGAAASGKAIKFAAGFAMTPVLKQARANAPKGDSPHPTYKGRTVAPGFLSRSIKKKAKLSRDKKTAWVDIRIGESEAFYGRFVERGTVNMRAAPWLRPAMLSQKAIVLFRYKSKLRERIKSEASK